MLLDKFDGLSKELFHNQLINQGKKPTGVRYSKEIKEFALTLSYYSPKALVYCRYLMHVKLLLKLANLLLYAVKLFNFFITY